MRKVTAIIRRELIAYFSSPLAYIVITAFLLMQGLIFSVIVSLLSRPGEIAMTPLRLFFGGTIFFWFYLVVIPLITMRLIAEERRSGTIEVLLTAPVTEAQVIFGKFIAAWLFYMTMWAPTLLYVYLLHRHNPIDLGPVAASYLGVALVGVLFLGVGIFASTLTRNQIIAAVLSFAALIVLFSVGLADLLVVSSSPLKPVIAYMNLWEQMDRFSQGIIDTRHVVYQLSVGVLFLFLATKSLEVNKWR